jgi:hypothetical protein
MTIKELEARIKTLEEMVKTQAVEIRTLKDIEAIKRLQRAYGYYLEHWMAQEVINLFSDSPEVSLDLAVGTFLGKTGIKRYFQHNKPDKEFLHQMMQLSGVVDVDVDGKTAKGRWYGFGAIALPGGKGVRQNFMCGIYTVDYIKENGIWKFLKLQFDFIYSAKPLEGWVNPERVAAATPGQSFSIKPDVPRIMKSRYPSGYIVPFHYNHPVTGEKTGEDTWNASLNV